MSNILGTRIKELRTKHKLTQLDLSSHLNIGNTTLSQYESGQRIPSDEIKMKICDFFGVSLDYLVGRVDTPTARYIELDSPDSLPNTDDIIPLETSFRVAVNSQELMDLIAFLQENKIAFEIDPVESEQTEKPLFFNADGSLTEKSKKAITDFIASNADILKRLIDKDE